MPDTSSIWRRTLRAAPQALSCKVRRKPPGFPRRLFISLRPYRISRSWTVAAVNTIASTATSTIVPSVTIPKHDFGFVSSRRAHCGRRRPRLDAGRPANGEDWRICRPIHVAATDEEAHTRVYSAESGYRHFFGHMHKVYTQLGGGASSGRCGAGAAARAQ